MGQASQSQGRDAQVLCLTTSGGAAEYTLVTFAANPSSQDRIGLAVQGQNLAAPSAPADPRPSRAAALDRPGHGPEDRISLADPTLDARLRALERRELTPRIRGAPAPEARAAPTVTAGSVPAVGETMTLNTQTKDPCENPRYREGVVEAVSDRAVVVADTENPDGGFSRSQYEELAATFATLIAPLAERNFGTPSDIDGNGRVILFFTEEVNRLSPPDADFFIGGFFFARDLFPREEEGRFQACPHSNEAELLYLMVPDPNGEAGPVRTRAFVERVTLNTMIHELQHLTNAARRLHIIESATPFEEVWLDEALSHTAEELLFYEASEFLPGQNLGAEAFPEGTPARDVFNRHQAPNTFRLERFLQDPAGNSPYNAQDLLATRGASWHFLRYAMDRRGGDQSALLRSLVDSETAGLANLSNAFASSELPLSQWFTDWAVALFADDEVDGIDDRHRARSWNHRSLFGAINEDEEEPFPLRIRTLEHGTLLAEDLTGGGAAYFRFFLEAGETGSVELTSLGGPPPAGLRAVVLRTR